MCRNIKPLFNFSLPATSQEINDASLQFVRKVSGFTKPSKINEAAFHKAVEEISKITKELLITLVTESEPKDREVEKEKARIRNTKRFGESPKISS